MKIGIDISQAAYKGSGVARYCTSLVESLVTYDSKNKYVFFYSSLRKKLDPSIRELIKKQHTLIEYRLPISLLSFFWNTLHIFPIELFIGKVDIFMSSDWTEPPSKSAIKVTTIHDMVIYLYPETTTSSTTFNPFTLHISPNIVAQQKKKHKLVQKESSAVFADSQHTADDIQKHLQIDKKDIHLLYPAVTLPKKTTAWDGLKNTYNITTPFILSVGKLEPRKNIKSLISAFSESHLTNIELLIVGDMGWGENTDHNIPGVRYLGFVPDEDLQTLYQHAEFFVFPSLYEGFGYPILEAMGNNCPVACSQSSSLSEIGNDAVLYFDPLHIHSISKALITLNSNASLRKELQKKGKARFAEFSSQKFAHNFVRIVDTIYHDNRS